jgi:hypothetical protein
MEKNLVWTSCFRLTERWMANRVTIPYQEAAGYEPLN